MKKARFTESATIPVSSVTSTPHTVPAPFTYYGGSLSSSALPQTISTFEHERLDDSSERTGSKKLKLMESGSLPSGAPMSADADLSTDDLRVECLLDRFERQRIASKSNDPWLSRSTTEQFLEGVGLDEPERDRVPCDLLKLGQSQDDVHIAEIFSQPKATVTPSRVGLTPGVLFDMSRSCWDLDVRANAERTCEYLRTERPVLQLGSPKCRAFMNLRSMSRRDPKFSKTLEAGLCHLKSLMEIYHWQNEQGRCFLHEDPHYHQESEHQGVVNLGIPVWSSSDKDETVWRLHDQLFSDR